MKIIALSDSHGSHWDIKNIPDGNFQSKIYTTTANIM
jgi:hypothetical protein